eukprot:4956762-Pyramimonas_sp.AAC.1
MRPVRGHSSRWGCKHLTKAESEQVRLENALLQANIRFLYMAQRLRVPALMVHPARASEWQPDAPSVWDLPEVHAL